MHQFLASASNCKIEFRGIATGGTWLVSNVVGLHRDGDVAVITVDNPPVNALKHAVRAGLSDALVQARDDTANRAIVLVGAGRTFIAGADIAEFGMPPQPPNLPDVIALIDNSGKPVVAAMHGTPLGGGLELALACHFRIAAPGTRLGLPEIKLGLIPGAGGTQRLPRLVGMDKAMAMILAGDPIPAQEALANGMIDEIVEGDLTAAAIAFSRRVLEERRPLGACATWKRRSSRCAAIPASSPNSRPPTPSVRADCRRPWPPSRHCAGRSMCRSTRR